MQEYTTIWIISLFKAFLPLYLAGIGIIVALIFIKKKKEKKYRKAGFDIIDNISGKEFEKYVKTLLKKMGFKVKETSPQADYGIDLIAESPDGRTTAIQCKRWNKKVGVKAIQEAVAGKNYYKTDEAAVITNNHFTKNAKKLAKANNVELIDRDILAEIILETTREDEKE